MERAPYLVRLGNRGLSTRYLVSWWDGATEPRPRDLAPGDIRVEIAGGISGSVWDLGGPEADAFRNLIIPMARSAVDAEPGGETAATAEGPVVDRDPRSGPGHGGQPHEASTGAGLLPPDPRPGNHAKEGGIPGIDDPVGDDDAEPRGIDGTGGT